MRLLPSCLAALALALVACAEKKTSSSPVMKESSAQAQVPRVLVTPDDGQGGVGKPVLVDKIVKTDAEWAAMLTPDQFFVTRAKGTERPFCGTLLDNHKTGTYH